MPRLAETNARLSGAPPPRRELRYTEGVHLLVIRHAESEANVQQRMQGLQDSPLSVRGREQAALLGRWLERRRLTWDAAYTSPLARARETARIVEAEAGGPSAEPLADLHEVDNGSLQGLDKDEIVARHPGFFERSLDRLGDFAAFGGESYDDVRRRVDRVVGVLAERHREAGDRVLLVGHGGINFQLVKRLICLPVPAVCILRYGNATATQIRMRDRRGVWMGEVSWHVPLELMGGAEGETDAGLFR